MAVYSNPRTGEWEDIPEGFSWTTLIFGPFPALLRGHLSAFFLMGLAYVAVFAPSQGVGYLILGIIFGFFYNHWYKGYLINRGYVKRDNKSQFRETKAEFVNESGQPGILTYRELDGRRTVSKRLENGEIFKYDADDYEVVSFQPVSK